MSFLKEYKGVKIFVTKEGEFYCDANTNFEDYKKKTFASIKLPSIEKAIDNYTGQEVDGNEYYSIEIYSSTIKELKVVRRIGNRLFFDDGSDTSNFGMKELYPKSVENTQEFTDLKVILEEMKKNSMLMHELYEAQNTLRINAINKLSSLKKIVVC